MRKIHNLTKRMFDILFGLIGIIVVSPLFIVIAIAIKLTSKGSIFFKQARLGLNGKLYNIYKFRSMVENAENMGTGLFNYENDPRVTKIGGFLRNTSLDEFPQFINIIKGDMSFVGPRPPVSYELGDYKDFDDNLKKCFTVKPGVTGLAQVSGRNELSWSEKITFNLEYIENFYKWGVIYDIKLIILTLFKVLKNEGSHELSENSEQDMARVKQIKKRKIMKLNFDLLNNISAEHGDSFYLLYSARFAKNYDDFLGAFQDIYPKTTIGYSYKTNYTPKLCKIIDDKGGYAEVVSDMEYSLAINIGVSPENIIVNGPYKPKKALERFLLNGSIVNLDSYKEVALLKVISNEHPDETMLIGLRCNFDINNDNVSRFGLDVEGDNFFKVFNKLKQLPNVKIMGIHCHFPDRNIQSYTYRADKILALADKLFESPPSYIDIGGGYFGKMDDSLKKQFKSVHEYSDYAKAIATRFNDFYASFDEKSKPTLILEPGSALVADTMEFVAKVIDIKNIRGSSIAMTSGSKFNIGLLSSSVNMPLTVFSGVVDRTAYETIDISGYTCIESDYLFKNYTGYLNEDDYLVFSNVGSYSVVFKPPFILPNVPVLEYDNINEQYSVIKRQETVDDIFQTFHI